MKFSQRIARLATAGLIAGALAAIGGGGAAGGLILLIGAGGTTYRHRREHTSVAR